MEPSGVPSTSREAPTVVGCGECARLLNYGTRWSEFKVGFLALFMESSKRSSRSSGSKRFERLELFERLEPLAGTPLIG
jgi:hypothetical protein